MYRTRGNKFFLATHFFVVAAGFSLRSGVNTRRLKPAATEQTRNSLWVHSGDIITKFGDKVVRNLYDLTYCLKEYNPGDVVEIIILRGDKEMKLKCTLESRK